ncbi:MAG TPA: exosortase/archaeosortase family protein [Thermoguttaceae bacterium]
MTTNKLNQWKSTLLQPTFIVATAALTGIFLFLYKSTITSLIHTYWTQPDYVHGFFVPVFSIYLLWYRRDMLPAVPTKGSWWGLAFFGIWALICWSGVYFHYSWFDKFSIVPCVAAIMLFIGGWEIILWAWPAIVFLFFIVPLPGLLSSFLSDPLQRIGTQVSVFVIQTIGIPAWAQGNQIILREPPPLSVEEACSGIKMLMLFFTLCVGAAFIMRKPVWEKVAIVISAIPIAVISNVFRITLTAILSEMASQWPSLISKETAREAFHSFAGLLMMPLALLILWGEIALISKLMLEPVTDRTGMVRETSRKMFGVGIKPKEGKGDRMQ